MLSEQLSFPYRSYNFGNVITNFDKQQVYNQEIVRCFQFLSQCEPESYDSIVLGIGSVIDNLNWEARDPDIMRFVALPQCLRTAQSMLILSISPLSSSEPAFIMAEKSAGRVWRKKSHLVYEFSPSTGVEWIYHHFDTLFPEFVEQDFATENGKKVYWKGTSKRVLLSHKRVGDFRNNIIYREFPQRIQASVVNGSDLQRFVYNDMLRTSSSDKDQQFVESFARVLTSFIERFQGRFTILNFAVFRNLYDRRASWYFFKSFYEWYQRNRPQNSVFLTFSFKDIPGFFRFRIDYGVYEEVLKNLRIKRLRYVGIAQDVLTDIMPTEIGNVLIFNLPPLTQQTPIRIRVGRYGDPYLSIQVLPSTSIHELRQKLKQSGLDTGRKDMFLKGKKITGIASTFLGSDGDIPMTERQKTLMHFNVQDGNTIIVQH